MILRLPLLVTLVLSILFFLADMQFVFSQKISFVEKVDSLGNTSVSKYSFQIDPIKGSVVYLIYDCSKPVMPPKAYFFIDKKELSGSYKEFDNQKVSIKDSIQQRVISTYLFTKEGSYKVLFANAEKKMLASAFLQIKFATNIVFCEQIDENERPQNYTNKFSLKPNLEIYSFLKLSKPINCSSISHQIYRYTGKNYTEQIFVGKFSVNPNWEYTYVKSSYTKIGKYKIIITSDTNKILGISYLEIK